MERRRDDNVGANGKNKDSSSVAGTLDRLVKAGYAARRMESVNGRVRYIYEPVFSEEEAANEITTKILDSLVDAFGPLAVANFSKYSDKK